MEPLRKPIPEPPPPAAARFTWRGLLLAVVVAPLFGLAWAWVGNAAQFYFAPLILFPLVLGVFVGLSVVALVRFAQVGHRTTTLAAVVLAATAAAVGQHYTGYLAACDRAESAIDARTPAGQDLSALIGTLRPRLRRLYASSSPAGPAAAAWLGGPGLGGMVHLGRRRLVVGGGRRSGKPARPARAILRPL